MMMKKNMRVLVPIIGATICICLFLWAYLYSSKPTRRAQESASIALYSLVPNPESISIRAISQVDSVFGKDYITDEEMINLGTAMSKVNEKVMESTNNFENIDFENTELNDLMTRHMTAMTTLRSLSQAGIFQSKKKDFSGWKVKIEYDAISVGGIKYRSEYWFFLDPSGKHVISSFEVPLIFN